MARQEVAVVRQDQADTVAVAAEDANTEKDFRDCLPESNIYIYIKKGLPENSFQAALFFR